jgi:hypothetical protein
MLIRLDSKSNAMNVSSEESEKMVKSRDITVDSPIKSKFIDDGSWVSITNLEMFHRFCPDEHPP